MKTFRNWMLTLAAMLVVGAPTMAVAASERSTAFDAQQVSERVRKQLVTLPYYGVFDNLAYKLEGNTVTLYGQVVRPTTRSAAAKRVAKIDGVERVVNNIEVLPLSSFDNSIRARAYREIFRSGGLYRYAMGANPSLHIVVNRGHVTLEGVVSNRMDANLAYMAASGVPGVFSVKNNLRIASEL